MLVGQVSAVALFLLQMLPPTPCALAFLAAMFVDWALQRIGAVTASNRQRFIAGILGGLGYLSVIIQLLSWAADTAFRLAFRA